MSETKWQFRRRSIASVWLVSLCWCVSALGSEVRFAYDPATGNLSYVSDVHLTTLELKSDDAIFTGPRPAFVDGTFDVFKPTKLFFLKPEGAPLTLDFGPAVTPALSPEYLANAICINGSMRPFGSMPPAGIVTASGDYIPFKCSALPPPTFVLQYDATTGSLSFDASPDDATATKLTTLLIDSTAGNFTGPKPGVLSNSFDVYRPNRLFHFDTAGFGDLAFGAVLPPSLTESQLVADLCVAGSLKPNGNLVDVHLGSATGPLVGGCDVTPGGTDVPTLPGESRVTLIYNPAIGELVLSTQSVLTTLEITSAGHLFTGTPQPGLVEGSFDVFRPDKLFVLRPEGLTSQPLGAILPPGLSLGQIIADLSVRGSTFPSGTIDQVDFAIIPIPEPTSGSLVMLGAGVLIARGRGKRRVARTSC